jgi:hypothetical protein
MTGESAERSEDSVDARLDVALALAQGGEPKPSPISSTIKSLGITHSERSNVNQNAPMLSGPGPQRIRVDPGHQSVA